MNEQTLDRARTVKEPSEIKFPIGDRNGTGGHAGAVFL